MLQHYITIKYLPDTPTEHREEFCRRMLALQQTIAEVEEIQIGCDLVGEARSWSLLIKLLVADKSALVRYQQHPDHQAVIQFNAPYVADVGVIDFENFLAP
ncbi:MAG: Dabb family protein [Oceanospirillaceae bacterium]|nr:Dabb family protein [Oceanospirillaceae bacterium]